MKKNQKKKNKGGRPKSITKKVEEEIIKLLADGLTQNQVCRIVNVHPDTLIKHKKSSLAFSERFDQAKLEMARTAHKSVKLGMVRDWKAGSWWLERIYPERFRERKEVDVKEERVLIDDAFLNETTNKSKRDRDDKSDTKTKAVPRSGKPI